MIETTLVNFENNYFSANVDKIPLIHLTFSEHTPTDEEFAEFINYMDSVQKQKHQNLILNDARKGNYMKSKHRIDFGNWTKENNESIKRNCKGIAFIMSSVMTKIMLKGIFMIQSPPYEYIIVDDIEKAENWITQKLQE